MSPIVLLIFALLGVGHGAADAAEWRIRVELGAAEEHPGQISASVLWLGERKEAHLQDNGQNGDVKANDGILSAEFRGPPIRALPITFMREEGGFPLVGHWSVERVPMGGGTLAFGLIDLTNLTIQRLSPGGTGEQVERREMLRTAAGAIWSLIALLLALSLVPSRKLQPRANGTDPRARWWRDGLQWLGIAILWTWPAAIGGGERAIGRHFDLAGTIWSISASDRLLFGLSDTTTAWPIGALHSAFDSFLLLPIGALFADFDPVQVHALLGIVGVAASAWAADWFAQSLGATRPWSMIAGFTFGLSGLAATALLEGHVYHVLNPWMPLFAGFWWRTCGPDPTRRDALLSAVCFSLTMLTTAYLGAATCLVAAGFLLGAHWRREANWRLIGSSIVLMLPVVAWVYLGFAASAGEPETAHRILLGSAQLSNLGIPTPEIDRAAHSVSAGLGGIVLAVSLLAPLFLVPGPWRTLYGTAWLSLLFAFGPMLAVDAETTLVPLPTYPLWQLPILGHLRFPIRLLWAWLLCAGALAAMVASASAQAGRGRWLLPVVVAHAFFFVALPFRQMATYAPAPSIFEQDDVGPMLELMGSGVDPGGEFENWQSATSCLYQARHQQPIAEDCVSLPVQANPRARIQRWVEDRLRDGQADLVRKSLESMGFGAVVWQPDLYGTGDQMRMKAALADWPEPEIRTDGGGHFWRYRLTPATEIDVELPLDQPSRSHGRTPLTEDATIQHAVVQLHVTSDPGTITSPDNSVVAHWEAARHEVHFVDAGGTARVEPLTNTGDITGDWPDDYTWMALLRGPLQPATELSLVTVDGGQKKRLWSGPVQFAQTNDRVAFQRTSNGARPTNVSADSPHPAARRGTSSVVLMGWATWLTVLMLWFVKRRRERPALRHAAHPPQ